MKVQWRNESADARSEIWTERSWSSGKITDHRHANPAAFLEPLSRQLGELREGRLTVNEEECDEKAERAPEKVTVTNPT